MQDEGNKCGGSMNRLLISFVAIRETSLEIKRNIYISIFIFLYIYRIDVSNSMSILFYNSINVLT